MMATEPATIQPIILAAGASQRFGSCKLLLEVEGKTLLQHCIDKLEATSLPAPIIVTGAWHRQLQQRHPTLALLENPHWQAGMGNSLAFAARQLNQQCDAAMVVLADQCAVTTEDLIELIRTYRQQSAIVCSHYNNRRGAPAIFPRSTFSELAQLDGDQGARTLLRGQQDNIIAVPLARGAIDIDTRDDWTTYGESLWKLQ